MSKQDLEDFLQEMAATQESIQQTVRELTERILAVECLVLQFIDAEERKKPTRPIWEDPTK